MNWKIVVLAILLLSAVGVTIGVTRMDSEILATFRGGSPIVYSAEQIQLEPIDADGPGG